MLLMCSFIFVFIY